MLWRHGRPYSSEVERPAGEGLACRRHPCQWWLRGGRNVDDCVGEWHVGEDRSRLGHRVTEQTAATGISNLPRRMAARDRVWAAMPTKNASRTPDIIHLKCSTSTTASPRLSSGPTSFTVSASRRRGRLHNALRVQPRKAGLRDFLHRPETHRALTGWYGQLSSAQYIRDSRQFYRTLSI